MKVVNAKTAIYLPWHLLLLMFESVDGFIERPNFEQLELFAQDEISPMDHISAAKIEYFCQNADSGFEAQLTESDASAIVVETYILPA